MSNETADLFKAGLKLISKIDPVKFVRTADPVKRTRRALNGYKAKRNARTTAKTSKLSNFDSTQVSYSANLGDNAS